MTLEQLLNVFWLRPETAMWREIDIRSMIDFEFNSPSLDLGCGDGLFSFIRAGGKLDSRFDAFQSVKGLDKFFDQVDIFDSFTNDINPIIIQETSYKIDVGFDHKENLLKKARTLGLHKEFKVGDANKALPFGDNTFESIFSNIIYWLNDPRSVFAEIRRILKPGGKACVMLPNNTMPDFSFYNVLCKKNNNPNFSFLEKLDRGRFSDNIRQARSKEKWCHVFNSVGLRISSHRTHLSKTAIQIWDVGLRPLFPVLKKMVDCIDEDNLLSIKEEWITILKQFLGPIVELDQQLNQGAGPAFHRFILEK